MNLYEYVYTIYTNLIRDLIREPFLLVFIFFIVGLIVGSFLNVVIYRIPIMMARDFNDALAEANKQFVVPRSKYTLCVPRSACTTCGHTLSAIENIPVISYLFLRGKCKTCLKPISIRYPLVELLTGILSAAVAYQFGVTATAFMGVILVWVLIAVAFIDYDTQFISDEMTLPLLWLGLLFNSTSVGFVSLSSSVYGAVIGYLLFWSVYWIFKLLTGREGMGYGDFKLLAAIGAWLGAVSILPVVIISSVLAVLVNVVLMTCRVDDSKPFPFGPYLSIAGIVFLFNFV